jgi:hypothetical protein
MSDTAPLSAAPDLDLIDDPYRTCAQCDQRHYEEYGHSCDVCDEWICANCWRGEWGDPPHDKTDEHGRREGFAK